MAEFEKFLDLYEDVLQIDELTNGLAISSFEELFFKSYLWSHSKISLFNNIPSNRDKQEALVVTFLAWVKSLRNSQLKLMTHGI